MKQSLIKSISVILCFLICLSVCPVSFAEQEVDSAAQGPAVSGEEAATLIDQAVLLILSRYKFDVKKEELYRDALKNIIEKHPELLEDAFRGMFDNLDEDYASQTEIDTLNTKTTALENSMTWGTL